MRGPGGEGVERKSMRFEIRPARVFQLTDFSEFLVFLVKKKKATYKNCHQSQKGRGEAYSGSLPVGSVVPVHRGCPHMVAG